MKCSYLIWLFGPGSQVILETILLKLYRDIVNMYLAEKQKRRTLQKEDIEDGIKDTEIFDFLVGLSWIW